MERVRETKNSGDQNFQAHSFNNEIWMNRNVSVSSRVVKIYILRLRGDEKEGVSSPHPGVGLALSLASLCQLCYFFLQCFSRKI
jgi:hypothetical protein